MCAELEVGIFMIYFLAVGGRSANCTPKAPQGFVAKIAAIALAFAAVSLPTTVQAQTYIWGGTGSSTNTTDYSTGTNWSTGGPPGAPGQAAIFSSSGSPTVDVATGLHIPDSWTFDAASQSYTITGNAVAFSGLGPNLVNNANSGQSISIANAMTGASLVQAGASTLTLSGADNFSSTTISAGTLALTGSGSLTGSVNLSNAAGTF